MIWHLLLEKTLSRTRFDLQTEILEKLLENEKVKDKRIAVISVTGAFRTGKSFFLNYLIRYLTHLENESGTSEWLGEENEELTGFTWRRGAGIDTHWLTRACLMNSYTVAKSKI